MPHSTAGSNSISDNDVGIASIGLCFPSKYLPIGELAALRGVDPNKYTVGLGCLEMALCGPDETVVDLAVRAAERALERWPGDRGQIGMIVVGSESALDMSRPLSAWVADRLDLRGAVRSYEVKHACYGGTLALRQALEWKWSGASQGKAALVIASDVALYEPASPGEPTQGAGAVAMVVDRAAVAAVDRASFPWSEPAFDFWRPVGEAFPKVEGQLSLDCYKRATEECFRSLVGEQDPADVLEAYEAISCHVPFPKMVRKAIVQMGESFGWDEEQTGDFYDRKVVPSMEWNQRCGNAYTASLWISVAQALAGCQAGERIAAFSYGSGFGAELLSLTAGPDAASAAWTADAEADFAAREALDGPGYETLRQNAKAAAA